MLGIVVDVAVVGRVKGKHEAVGLRLIGRRGRDPIRRGRRSACAAARRVDSERMLLRGADEATRLVHSLETGRGRRGTRRLVGANARSGQAVVERRALDHRDVVRLRLGRVHGRQHGRFLDNALIVYALLAGCC